MLTQADIAKMTVPERWDAIEQLWESIIASGADIPSPAWHEEVLKERHARVESGNAKFFTIDEVREKLRIPRK